MTGNRQMRNNAGQIRWLGVDGEVMKSWRGIRVNWKFPE
jgi:hypothetical protein